MRTIARYKEDRGEIMGLAARVKGKARGETRNRSQICAHCHRTGHDQSECFQVIGYPEWWGDRPRSDGITGGRGKS